ncbi:MAG: hypothetical protein LC657_07210, partial [Desulfobacteraceae bacterium]|nr:hypothetical protein [Desulfobacteraceae bacterium]
DICLAHAGFSIVLGSKLSRAPPLVVSCARPEILRGPVCIRTTKFPATRPLVTTILVYLTRPPPALTVRSQDTTRGSP